MPSSPVDLFLPATTPQPDGAYRLLGADCSYYTAKISACLRYKRVPHANVLATRQVFTEELLPRVGWPVIPVLVAPDGTTLQDTSEMYDHLEAAFPTPATLPADAPGRFLCYLLELAFDEWLKIPALHYRWNHDNDFAVAEFGRNNDPDLPPARQIEVGARIATRFRGWLDLLGVNAGSIPTIEAEYHALLALLDAHFDRHDFMLGAAPTLADFALYGPFHAHLYRDPNSGRVMRERAPAVVQWVCRMGAPPPVAPLPARTTLPDTLLAPLRQVFRDYVPVLLAQTAALREWLATHDEVEPPRSLGVHEVVLGRGTAHGCTTTRALFSYDHWMLQRALAVHAGSSGQAREAVEALAHALGVTPLLALPAAPLLTRRRFRLERC